MPERPPRPKPDRKPSHRLEDSKVCKFQVPLHLHLELHRHRLLSGHSVSDTVSDALEAYFEAHLPEELR